MTKLLEHNNITVYKVIDRTKSIQVIFVEKIGGLTVIADISKEDFLIFNFITTSDFCYAGMNRYQEVIDALILKLKEEY